MSVRGKERDFYLVLFFYFFKKRYEEKLDL